VRIGFTTHDTRRTTLGRGEGKEGLRGRRGEREKGRKGEEETKGGRIRDEETR
jgi:hypothetical protein